LRPARVSCSPARQWAQRACAAADCLEPGGIHQRELSILHVGFGARLRRERSTLGFVAYRYLLLHETPSRIGTYAYVNPLVAVVAGQLPLGERLDALQVAGSTVIFAGVVQVRSLSLFPLPRGKRSRVEG
jgi:EamA-like transporter family